jgi:hypothetical protein
MPDGSDGWVDLIAGARYIDRCTCANGEWLISDRTMVYDWTRIDPVGAVLEDPTLVVGRRDRDDPSWRRFGPAGR